jgi:hypothetical protein
MLAQVVRAAVPEDQVVPVAGLADLAVVDRVAEAVGVEAGVVDSAEAADVEAAAEAELLRAGVTR